MSGDWCNEEDGNLPSRFEESKSLLRDGLFDSSDAFDGAIESYAYLREFGVKVGITSLNEKGETVRISGGTIRIYYCDSCVDTSGHVCPWNCTFQIRASRPKMRKDKIECRLWRVNLEKSCLQHVSDCSSNRKLRTVAGVVAAKGKDLKARLRSNPKISASEAFADVPISPKKNHNDKKKMYKQSEEKRRRKAETQRLLRALNNVKATELPVDDSEEYNRLKEYLKAISYSNPGSVQSFEAEMDESFVFRFKRAFLMLPQFARVAKWSGIKLSFLDAGTYSIYYLYSSTSTTTTTTT